MPAAKKYVIQRFVTEELTITMTAAQRKQLDDQKLIDMAAQTPLNEWSPVEVDYHIVEVVA